MTDIVHMGEKRGFVPAVQITNGLGLRMDKEFFFKHFVKAVNIETQQLYIRFDVVIEKATDEEVFVRFDSKGRVIDSEIHEMIQEAIDKILISN